MPYGGVMSLLIYTDGLLIGDRRGTRNAEHERFIRDMKKTHVSKCKRLALGVVGEEIHPTDLPKVMTFFINSLTDHYHREHDVGYAHSYSEEESLVAGLENRRFILMTADRAFIINFGSLTEITHEPWYCSGNGMAMADVFLTAGMSPGKVIEAVAKLNLEVGHSFTRVEQSRLKPLIKKVEE
ncbi:hypothetical protein FDJ23_gp056 [Erwinia phage vB_EamM_Desertfox]|uniref:Uncharacterized protein n=6 Tax=Agricanvirus TaxID=1984776 RepID=A0A191ZBV1_9CAUD|nr:hypothetical protein FDH97_gp059 [Erwinia phage vB_EamM_Deimos-Minion]YP_009606164.1 hypothetical protein FDI00_gp058 [Erwinia phage vB_EamM_Special G]YP_009621797.1 hypothetical protein FDJ23_gp056 [Erwinia phage vB_EamM_Desertfox]AUG85845.1 hypothetical protein BOSOLAPHORUS_57 [Erwinia phage vB_EamM_Bosolaphorus]AUG86806.1 hypothetical protein MORTIMER_57 [Erwinia phage vB_EamM_Mortimer]ANH52157.1 hypothetical protein DM_59 [Erwinia phage vB_EamM_Deimos-Minion]ANJ64868.1 hypothetical pro